MSKLITKSFCLIAAFAICATTYTTQADYKTDLAVEALGTFVKSTAAEKPAAETATDDKASIASKAIDALIKTCAYDSLNSVLNVHGYTGVLYKGLRIKEFYSADSGAGSIWGVTFQSPLKNAQKAIPEAASEKSFASDNKDLPPIMRSMTASNDNTQYTNLECSQFMGGD